MFWTISLTFSDFSTVTSDKYHTETWPFNLLREVLSRLTSRFVNTRLGLLLDSLVRCPTHPRPPCWARAVPSQLARPLSTLQVERRFPPSACARFVPIPSQMSAYSSRAAVQAQSTTRASQSGLPCRGGSIARFARSSTKPLRQPCPIYSSGNG